MSKSPQSITWTEDRKLVVAELLREGLSAGQMSKRLGISRNAIISVIHRDKMLSEIGLAAGVGGARTPKAASSPYKTGRMKTAARSPARQSQPASVAVAPVIEPEPAFIREDVIEIEAPIDSLGLPLSDLNLRQCRFAVNNAAKGEQHLFCGHPVKIGSSFCEHHHRRVFVRPTKAGVA